METGPYGLVRHPIYTGIIAMGAALALEKATAAAIVGEAALCAGYFWKGRFEESFLSSALGAEKYGAYRRRIPMLIPFLPKKG